MRIPLKFAFVFVLFLAACMPESSAAPDTRIDGVVMDPAGGTVPGASLRLFSLERIRETKTGTDGRFDFASLPPGSYDLEVDTPGFKTKILEHIQVAENAAQQFSIALQLLNPGCDFRTAVSFENRSDSASLKGSVNDVRQVPLRNATLTLISSDSGQVHVTASNDKGKFQFIDLEPGKYSLRVTSRGYWDGSAAGLRIARENLTVVSPISMSRKNEHQIIICQ